MTYANLTNLQDLANDDIMDERLHKYSIHRIYLYVSEHWRLN